MNIEEFESYLTEQELTEFKENLNPNLCGTFYEDIYQLMKRQMCRIRLLSLL
jgi:hypothetical protein